MHKPDLILELERHLGFPLARLDSQIVALTRQAEDSEPGK